MATEVTKFTEADEDDLATKEKKLEDAEKRKKKAVSARDFGAVAGIHAEMQQLMGQTDDPKAEMIRLRKCTKLVRMLRKLIDEIKPKLAEAIAQEDFKEASALKAEKDMAEQYRHPLLHYVTRFTRNRQKAANPRYQRHCLRS